MKNTVTLNIGLLTSEAPGKRRLESDYVEDILCAHGFANLVTRSAVHASNTEPTLVLELVTADELEDVLPSIACLSDALEQDCIAVHAVAEDGTSAGYLVGDKAEAWSPFNPEYFLTLDGRTLARVQTEESNLAAL